MRAYCSVRISPLSLPEEVGTMSTVSHTSQASAIPDVQIKRPNYQKSAFLAFLVHKAVYRIVTLARNSLTTMAT